MPFKIKVELPRQDIFLIIFYRNYRISTLREGVVRKKSLKYRDLPWALKRRIDASGPMMQPRKSENPTVKNILDRLKASEQRSLANDASLSAKQKREVIDVIENYLSENNMDSIRPRQPEL